IPTRTHEFFLVLGFATDEINRNPYLLSNISLKFSVYVDMCFDTWNIMNMLYSENANNTEVPNYDCYGNACNVVLIGPSWTTSMKLAIIHSTPNKFWNIFFGPFHPIVNDKVLFPYVYQVALMETCLSQAMVSLMIYFTWTWIGVVMSDDDQGIQFLLSLKEEMQKNGVCLAFVNVIPDSMQLYMSRAVIHDEQIMTSSTKAVIIYGEINSTLEISFKRWEDLDVQRIWITPSQWDVITTKKDFSLDPFLWIVSFKHHHGKISKFRNFMQTVNTSKYPVDITQMRTTWNYFNYSFCKTNYSVMNSSFNTILEWLSQHRFEMSQSEEGYNLYNAVYAVAHTYHDIIFHQVDSHATSNFDQEFYDCHQVNDLPNMIKP
ncbi:vomeronasal type-2 receptor 116-like isoform X1, partial [Sigmodon hispidus]